MEITNKNKPSKYKQAFVFKDGPSYYSVWLCSTLTGDKRDFLKDFTSREGALKYARRINIPTDFD